MNSKGAIFKVEWRTRKGKEPFFLRIDNKGDSKATNVSVNIDLGDGNDPIYLNPIPNLQPGNSNDMLFPSPEEYVYNSNWMIEVTLEYDDYFGHHKEQYSVTLKQ